jgi:ubiquinone/menaquinone biosynthesis C-methylase UbiE
MTVYTEHDVAAFFDQTLRHYLGFWDSSGVLHTGFFAGGADTDYQAAAERTSAVLAQQAGIGATSSVLDVGSGCGNFVTYLAERHGCRAEGVDLSEERVEFARHRVATVGGEYKDRVAFRHGSATELPYPSGAFSHVVSQDALFLVPDKPRSHAEILRVLRPGGVFACTDFLQPVDEISELARTHVYDRVRWGGGYSLPGYQEALTAAGFEVLRADDLERHIKQTYLVLGRTARDRAGTAVDVAAREWIMAFADSCLQIEGAIDRGEFSWGMFVARKPPDRRP